MPNSAKYTCVLRPLGSPTVSQKRSFVHVPVVPWPGVVCGAGHERGVYGYRRVGTGWYTGWVIPGPGTTQRLGPAARGGLKNQRSGPRKPHRGWSGWVLEAGRTGPTSGARPALVPPLPAVGPGQAPAGPSLYQDLPTGKRARFRPHFLKVSQNGKVSPKSV